MMGLTLWVENCLKIYDNFNTPEFMDCELVFDNMASHLFFDIYVTGYLSAVYFTLRAETRCAGLVIPDRKSYGNFPTLELTDREI